jgi:hypothetical protein
LVFDTPASLRHLFNARTVNAIQGKGLKRRSQNGLFFLVHRLRPLARFFRRILRHLFLLIDFSQHIKWREPTRPLHSHGARAPVFCALFLTI